MLLWVPKSNWISPKIVLQETRDRGKWLFAIESISEGETVIIWGGKNYTDANGIKQAAEKELIMQWDDDLFSHEDRGEDASYFLNHSCNSNLWMNGAFELITRRCIQKWEEVTADYALWEFREDYRSKWNCRCGEKDCRGQITGVDWKSPDVQRKYRDHFSPLINKRIFHQYP